MWQKNIGCTLTTKVMKGGQDRKEDGETRWILLSQQGELIAEGGVKIVSEVIQWRATSERYKNHTVKFYGKQATKINTIAQLHSAQYSEYLYSDTTIIINNSKPGG